MSESRMTRQARRNLIALGLLALFALPAAAQDPSAAHPSLRSLAALIDAAHYETNPIPIAPAHADGALLIDDVFVTPQGNVEVTLRNGSVKTITAWSIDVTVGSDSGDSFTSSRGEDKYTGLLSPNAPTQHSPLSPGEQRVVEYRLPAGRGTFEAGVAQGDYSVLGAGVGAVVFDDGSVAGRDVRHVLGFVLSRYARAAALSRLLGQVDSALQAGTLQQFLEDSLDLLEQEKRAVAAAVVDGPGPVTTLDSQRQQESLLVQQWLRSVFLSAMRASSRSEKKSLGLEVGNPDVDPVEILRAISSTRPAMLRSAIENTSSQYQSELGVAKANLPVALRAEIERIVPRTP